MSQRGRQRSDGERKRSRRSEAPAWPSATSDGLLSLAFLPGNLKSDLVELWNFAVSRPREAFVALITFIGTLKAAIELFGSGGSSSGGGSSSSNGIVESLSTSKPGALLLYILATVSIAWTLMLVTRMLSRARSEAWRLLAYGLALLFGLFLMFVGQKLLADDAIGGTQLFAKHVAFFVLAIGGAASVYLLKTGFRLANEFDDQVVERRSLIMLFFLISYMASIAIVMI